MANSVGSTWGIFQKPFEGTIADNLRNWETAGFAAFPGRSHSETSSTALQREARGILRSASVTEATPVLSSARSRGVSHFGLETLADPAQTLGLRQLAEQHRHEMVPAGEAAR